MLGFVIAASAPVDVRTDVLDDDAQSQRLHGDLLVRLLEEGWTVGPSADSIALRIESNDDGIVVIAESGARHAMRTVEPGPAGAVRLEVLHRAIEVLRELDVGPQLDEHATTIAIESFDGDGLPLPIDPAWVRAITEEGMLVIAADGQPSWRLCIREDAWSYARVAGDQPCELGSVQSSAASRDDVVEALRSDVASLRELESENGQRTPPRSRPAPAGPIPVTPNKARRRRPFVWASAGGGVATRSDHVEAALPMAVGVAHRSGFGGLARATVLVGPPVDRLHVLDAEIAVGPAWHRPVHPRIAFGSAVLIGAIVHRYRFGSEPAVHDAGIELAVPVWMLGRVFDGLAIGAGVDFGVGFTSWRHRIDGEVRWQRSHFRFAAMALLSWTWGWP